MQKENEKSASQRLLEQQQKMEQALAPFRKNQEVVDRLMSPMVRSLMAKGLITSKTLEEAQQPWDSGGLEQAAEATKEQLNIEVLPPTVVTAGAKASNKAAITEERATEFRENQEVRDQEAHESQQTLNKLRADNEVLKGAATKQSLANNRILKYYSFGCAGAAVLCMFALNCGWFIVPDNLIVALVAAVGALGYKIAGGT